MLQSQVGDHTSVNLRKLTECILANESVPEQATPCPCIPAPTTRNDTTITTTDLLLNLVNCMPQKYGNLAGVGPVCTEKSNSLDHIYTMNAGTGPRLLFPMNGAERTATRQPKIEYLCRTNKRPAASTYTSRVKTAAASFKNLEVYEHSPVPAPPCPLPPAPQAGVPLARNLPCGTNLRI